MIGVGDLESDIARAGMQHDPQPVLFVSLQLDEMISAAQGSQLVRNFVPMLRDDRHSLFQFSFLIPLDPDSVNDFAVLRSFMMPEPGGNSMEDFLRQCF